jgi:hypothetical protein
MDEIGQPGKADVHEVGYPDESDAKAFKPGKGVLPLHVINRANYADLHEPTFDSKEIAGTSTWLTKTRMRRSKLA